jgi:hypothetical protein
MENRFDNGSMAHLKGKKSEDIPRDSEKTGNTEFILSNVCAALCRAHINDWMFLIFTI